jgi:hypothetical protein
MIIRDGLQRKKSVLDRLESDRDVWVATADENGKAHLVPFSLIWDGTYIIVATELRSKSAVNMEKYRQARLAIGDTRDVTIIETKVEIVALEKASDTVSELFTAKCGWDPRTAMGDWAYFYMTPLKIQAWQNEEELKGRDLMKGGHWIV